MPEYRRMFIKGGIYFFTLVTYQRQKIFSLPLARLLFLKAVEHVRSYHTFTNVAYCILPDHIHMIWQLAEDDADYSKRINAVKRRFSMKYRQRFNALPQKNQTQINRRESTVWQRRYWEHYIRDEIDFQYHMEYIHFNPVKHGLVSRVRDWDASSFFSYVNLGFYDLDWGDNIQNNEAGDRFGE